MPWWIPEIIRLQRMERMNVMREMNMVPKLRLLAQEHLDDRQIASPTPERKTA